MIRKAGLANGAFSAIVSSHWERGGAGASALADSLIQACESSKKSSFKFLYDLNLSIDEKILTIAKEMYGAGSVEFSPKVKEIIRLYAEKVNMLQFFKNSIEIIKINIS